MADGGFDQAGYWIERHRTYAGDPRSVGNLSLSREENLRGDRALATALRTILRETGASSVLDLGCGYGRVCAALAGTGVGYVGVDVAPAAIEQARSAFPAAEFHVADLAGWSDPRRFDLVLCLYVLSNFVEEGSWQALLGTAAAAVAPGGVLVIGDALPTQRKQPAPHVVFRSAGETLAGLRAVGLGWDDAFRRRIAQSLEGSLAFEIRVAARTDEEPAPAPETIVHPAPPPVAPPPLLAQHREAVAAETASGWRFEVRPDGSLIVVAPATLAEGRHALAAGGSEILPLALVREPGGGRATIPPRELWRALWEAPHRPATDLADLSVLGPDGAVLARAALPLQPPRVQARLDQGPPNLIRGWAVAEHWPAPLELSVRIDGVPLMDVVADIAREDLARAGLPGQHGGFQIALRTSPVPFGAAESTVEIVWRASREVVARGTKEFGDLPARRLDRTHWTAALAVLRADPRPVAIVVPVHGALEETRDCLRSIVRLAAAERARVIAIDDASPDPAIWAMLLEFADRGAIEALRNPENLGFSGTINRGILAAGHDDVLLLNSDTIMPAGTIRSLRLAAYGERRIGTVTPLSDNAGPFSVPAVLPDSRHPDVVDDFARLVRQASAGLQPKIPTGHGFCLYVRRDCLDEIGLFDADAFPRGYGEENDFCMRASRQGWRHVMDDRAFVRHRQGASFAAAKAGLLRQGRAVIDARYPDYTGLVRREFARPEIAAIRTRIGIAARREPARKRLLFVISKETGGTPQTNLDLMMRLQDEHETFVLRANGTTIFLERFEGSEKSEMERHRLDEPVDAVTHRSDDYDAVVTEWLVAHAIELVHIRQFGWHGLGLFEIAGELGLPVVFSFHDFYTICPTIKLLDQDRVYCAGRCTEGPGECRVELWRQEQVPALKHRFVRGWKAMFAAALDRCAAFVTTSDYAKAVVTEHFPGIAAKPFPIIRHGRDFAAFVEARRVQPGEPLRVLVPGNVGVAKGADLLREIRRLDAAGELELHVAGLADKSLEGAGLVLHGRYERAEATGLFHRIGAHVGAVLSIWPETYCHTLTELWSAGLPTLGFDIGAVGERLSETGAGWLLPVSSAQVVYRLLLAIRRNPAEHAERCAAVARWQAGEGRTHGTGAMAEAYRALYETLA